MRIQNQFLILSVLLVCVMSGFLLVPNAQGNDTIEDLRSQIQERGTRLQEIEKEIANYQIELKKVGGEKNSLQKAINQLELERKKVQADIAYTEQKIKSTDLELDKLNIEIDDTKTDIEVRRAALSETLGMLAQADDESLIEILLIYDSVSDFWRHVDTINQLQMAMKNNIDTLALQKQLLDGKYEVNTEMRSDLISLQEQYADQSDVLIENKTEKAKLLSATKSEEAEYQRILKEKETARELILKELRDFESKLQFILDPNTIPAAGTAVFNWPVDNVIITQYFGGTEFAKRNASVYGGRAYHPGVDFGVPRGTKIYAPLAGTVRATGDTDLVPGCYSWGKWTLIDHPNGLSTLYAHQSVHSVVPGQQVATGEIIGYSGNTGYSTGPHLHFTVYAKAGVSVRKFNEIKAVTSCGAATTPVAATDAYIDPMLYLPPQ